MSFEYVFDGSTFVFKAKQDIKTKLKQRTNQTLNDTSENGSTIFEPPPKKEAYDHTKGKSDSPISGDDSNGGDGKKEPRTKKQETNYKAVRRKPRNDGKNGDGMQNINRIEERGFRTENDSTGRRKYFCNHCDYKILNYKKNSTYATALIRDHHNAVHLKRVLQCTECAYTTLKYKAMQGHRNLTHGLSAMRCSECVNTFIVEDDLIEHFKVKHNIIKEPSNTPRTSLVGEPRMPNGDRIPGMTRPQRKPRVAYQGFTSVRTGVKKSWKPGSQRLYEYTHTCDTCGFQARLINVMKGHMNKVHTGKVNKCPECSFQSHYMVNLTKHLKDAHKKMAEHCIAPGCKFKSIFPSKVQLHLFYKHHGRYDQERHSILIPIP